MGAVFALFAAFYYWFTVNKSVTSFTQYFEHIGVTHFFVTFVGVNVTFFPMHFLGISGMPRRISEYPISFYGWNLVATAGAFCSLIGVFILFGLLHYYYVNFYSAYITSYINTFYLSFFIVKADNDVRLFNQKVSNLIIGDYFNVNDNNSFFMVKSNNTLFNFSNIYSNLELSYFKKIYYKIYNLLFFVALYIKTFQLILKKKVVDLLYINYK